MKYMVTLAPHLRSKIKTSNIMGDVVIALLPALAVGVYRFGLRALLVTLVSVVTALAAEWLCSRLIYHRNSVTDLSCVVTGLLLAMSLPSTVPYWLVVVGSGFAVIVVKGFCGGIGKNIFNPALAARAFLMLFWPLYLTRFTVDGVAGATPLHPMQMPALPEVSVQDMFLGNIGGCIGEISTLALLLGGAYLVLRKVISLRIPMAYLATVAAVSYCFYQGEDPVSWMVYSLLGGGVVLGAIFMATDYSSSPVTPAGQIFYGIGCGILTMLFRRFGLFPEGVTYAILLMNALVWAIDYYTAPRRFGTKEGGAL